MATTNQSESIIPKDGDRAAIQAFALPPAAATVLSVVDGTPVLTGPQGYHYRFESDADVFVCSGPVLATANDLRLQAGVDEYFYVPENTQVSVSGAGTLRMIQMKYPSR